MVNMVQLPKDGLFVYYYGLDVEVHLATAGWLFFSMIATSEIYMTIFVLSE